MCVRMLRFYFGPHAFCRNFRKKKAPLNPRVLLYERHLHELDYHIRSVIYYGTDLSILSGLSSSVP